MSWFRDRETFHFCVVGTEEDKAEDHTCPHLAFSLPVLFHSSKHSVSEHRVISLGSSPLVAVDNNAEQKTEQLKVLLEQRSTDPPSHRLICTLERNDSHLGVVLQTCYFHTQLQSCASSVCFHFQR